MTTANPTLSPDLAAVQRVLAALVAPLVASLPFTASLQGLEGPAHETDEAIDHLQAAGYLPVLLRLP